jgi:hypothetical protein
VLFNFGRRHLKSYATGISAATVVDVWNLSRLAFEILSPEVIYLWDQEYNPDISAVLHVVFW